MAGAVHRTPARLALAFVALLALFGLALAVALYTFDRLGDAEADVADLEDAKHAGHAVAALIREQYIHQAHTVISWDASHLDHYEEAMLKTRRATERLQELARTREHRERAREISRLVAAADAAFRTRVVPGIAANDRAAVEKGHDSAERLVTEVVQISESLNRELEQFSMDARGHERALRVAARTALIWCFALAIAVAALLGIVLTRSLRARLEKLRAGAAGIARGDLSTRIAVAGADEFADLAKTFNQMAVHLERHQDELVQSQKLAAVGQLAAGVAHEINNPLGVILGYAKLLRQNAEVGALADAELGIIEDEARQCQRIVRELLDLARPPRFAASAIDLGDVVKDTVDRLAEARAIDAVELEVIATGATPIRADEAQLREVVSNLVTNAVEAKSTEITARVAARGQHAVLEVQDTGSGMPDEVREKAFDPFFTTKPRGTGLGLAITHAIVHAHGGEIHIDSEAGKGTCVRIELPLSR